MIAFRYTTTALSSLTYDANASYQKSYYCRIERPPEYYNKKDRGDMLNGYSYSHLLWRKKKYYFVISANELSGTDEAFFDAFYAAPFKYIADLSVGSPFYEEVIETDDNVPKIYDEDISFLPEITLNLTTKGTV